MSGLSSLWNDALGIKSIMLLLAATVLCAIGQMTIDQWTSFTQVIFGVYASGTTIQAGMVAFAARPASAPSPATGPAVSVVNNPST